jgi:hypothetical protein
MRISEALVTYMLNYVTIGYFDQADEPPEDVSGYADAAQSLREYAEESGNMPWLKLALAHLLSEPGMDLRRYNGSGYPFSARAMRELLEFLWQTYWPGESLPPDGKGPPVEIANISNEEWAAEKAAAHLPSG